MPAGTDPDFLDDFFRGNPNGSANYAQPADIVESGWEPSAFFRTIAGGPAGNNIIGVTFTFDQHFVQYGFQLASPQPFA